MIALSVKTTADMARLLIADSLHVKRKECAFSASLKISAEDIGGYVLLPGDPGRCETIASFFDDSRLVASSREFTTYTGSVSGQRVSVTSTGIGCPSAAIAMEELSALGAHTFIRVGTAGGMQPGMELGDLAIAQAAIRDEGTSQQYMPLAFPAVADLEVTLALRDAARALGVRYHVGVSHSKDSYYGEVEPQRMPITGQLQDLWSAWVQGHTLCSEMEASTLFVLARILGRRAGGVMLVAGLVESGGIRRVTPEEREQFIRTLAKTSVEAVRRLIEKDSSANS